MNAPRFLLTALLLIPILLSCSGRRDDNTVQTDTVNATDEGTAERRERLAGRWADSVCRAMTPRQRATQLLMPAAYTRLEWSDMERLRRYAAEYQTGGILLLQGEAEDAGRVADSLARWAPTGMWVAIDAEWGLGMRLRDAPVFPRNGRLDSEAGQRLLTDYGEEVARECRALGINMVMGPVADVAPEGSFIGSRSFGTDPQRVADLAVAYSRGLEAGGVVSVVKHFPGHGHGKADSHRRMPVNSISRDSLERSDLYPFRRYADAGLSGVMAGHIAVPALDPSGRPATVSRRMLTYVLRKEIGFKGLIITDALNMGGADGYTAADAIAAGADIVVAPVSTEGAIEEIMRRVADGSLSQSEVDDRCRRVLRFKYLHRVAGPEARRRPRIANGRLPKVLTFGTDTLNAQLKDKRGLRKNRTAQGADRDS